jgi:hypothetical protein
MRCDYCHEEFPFAVCPNCGKEIRQRSGFIVDPTNTLFEIPYSIGKLYARYYRIAFLRPDGLRPLKLCIGCEERFLEFLSGRKSWFNPVTLTPQDLEILYRINIAQLAASFAFEAVLNKSKLVHPVMSSFLSGITKPSNFKRLEEQAIRYVKMMQ